MKLQNLNIFDKMQHASDTLFALHPVAWAKYRDHVIFALGTRDAGKARRVFIQLERQINRRLEFLNLVKRLTGK